MVLEGSGRKTPTGRRIDGGVMRIILKKTKATINDQFILISYLDVEGCSS